MSSIGEIEKAYEEQKKAFIEKNRLELMNKVKELCKKYNIYETPTVNSIDILFIPLNICEAILPKIKEKLVYSNEAFYQFNQSSGIWENTSEATNIIVNHINEIINNIYNYIQGAKALKEEVESSIDVKTSLKKPKEETDDDVLEKLQKVSKSVDTVGFIKQIINHLKTLLKDNNFIAKLDSRKYVLAFKNGILDLKTGNFKQGLESNDFVSKFIDKDYKPSSEQDLKVIHDILFKICNANEEHLNYYSYLIGASFTGDSNKLKAFFAFVGQLGNNGKTTIIESLAVIMPCYVCKINNKCLYENASNRHKYLATTKGARIVYIEENIDGGKIDVAFIKEFADGKGINFEVLFQQLTTTIQNTSNLIIISQSTPVFQSDGGIANRYKQMQFNSSFDKEHTNDDYDLLKFVPDITLSDQLEGELAIHLINYFVKYSIKYSENLKFPELPEEWKDLSKETINQNDKIKELIENHCEVGQGFVLAKEEIESLLRKYEITIGQLRDSFKAKGFDYNKSKRSKGFRGVWMGIKIKDSNCEFSDDETD